MKPTPHVLTHLGFAVGPPFAWLNVKSKYSRKVETLCLKVIIYYLLFMLSGLYDPFNEVNMGLTNGPVHSKSTYLDFA